MFIYICDRELKKKTRKLNIQIFPTSTNVTYVYGQLEDLFFLLSYEYKYTQRL